MTSDKLLITNYFFEWWTIIARPIYFYAKLREEDWKKAALTFFLISAWLLAFVMTLAIFIIQYIPIGSTLVEGITGLKFLIILPVLITLAFVFFVITFLILGGLLVVSLGTLFYAVAFLLHYIYILMGGKGSLQLMLQSSFYSSAVVLAGIFPCLLAILTRFGWLELSLFRVGFNLTLTFTAIFIYGLWAVAGRKNYNVPKWQAFAGATAPVAALLIFGFLFDKIAFSKVEAWIAPLK